MQLWVIGVVPLVFIVGFNVHVAGLLRSADARASPATRHRVRVRRRAGSRRSSSRARSSRWTSEAMPTSSSSGVSLTVLLYRFGAAGMVFLVDRHRCPTRSRSAPTRVASRLGLRGLKRQRALANERARGRRSSRSCAGSACASAASSSDEQRAELDRADLRSPATTWAHRRGVPRAHDHRALVGGASAASSSAISLDIGPVLGLIVGLVLGAVAPVHAASAARRRSASRTSAAASRTSSTSWRSRWAPASTSPAPCVRSSRSRRTRDDPLVEEFTLILADANLGRTRKEALLEFADRAPAESVIGVRQRARAGRGARQPGRRRAPSRPARRVRAARSAPRRSPRRPASRWPGRSCSSSSASWASSLAPR